MLPRRFGGGCHAGGRDSRESIRANKARQPRRFTSAKQKMKWKTELIITTLDCGDWVSVLHLISRFRGFCGCWRSGKRVGRSAAGEWLDARMLHDRFVELLEWQVHQRKCPATMSVPCRHRAVKRDDIFLERVHCQIVPLASIEAKRCGPGLMAGTLFCASIRVRSVNASDVICRMQA